MVTYPSAKNHMKSKGIVNPIVAEHRLKHEAFITASNEKRKKLNPLMTVCSLAFR